MRDRYGREVSDLRISLTQRCNLRCVFCHMEGQPVATSELTREEIGEIAEAASRVGIDRVKLTGGEPTLRRDLHEIVAAIRPQMREVSMTTNGLLLEGLAEPLARAGLARVNVSLPSLDAETYRTLTGVDGLERAVRGIRAAARAGLSPIKLNVVAIAGSTAEPEAMARLVDFAQEVGAWIQVIEFENVRGRVDPSVYRSLHSDLGRLTAEAAAKAISTEHNRLHDRPRYTFLSQGRPVTIELVRPVENPDFCMACRRLRVTSDGRLKGCLMTNEGLLDLRAALDAPDPVAALLPLFQEAIRIRRPFFVGPSTPKPEPSSAPSWVGGPELPMSTVRT